MWVQDNQARSQNGVLRGMHFSVEPGQAKLVRCARGRVLDVVVDVRAGSPTFGRWEGVELDDERGVQVYVPVGFAHGYLVLSETADVVYKCSAYYDGAKERGIAWDDPEVGIDWPGRRQDRLRPRSHGAAALGAGPEHPLHLLRLTLRERTSSHRRR